jgi:DNA polymerase III epsilon subunit-like protein
MIELLGRPLVVIDVESSGTNPFAHDVLAVGLVAVSPDCPTMTVYVRQSQYVWTDYAKQLFEKYEPEWRDRAVPPAVACDAIEDYLLRTFGGREVTPVGHNVAFDLAFLKKLAYLGGRERLARLSHRAVDTHSLLYLLHLQGRLPAEAVTSDGAFRYFGIRVDDRYRHTALGDAMATRDLLLHLLEAFNITAPAESFRQS